MANNEDTQTLIRKMNAYVTRRYGGTGLEAWQRAFNDADEDHDGRIDESELESLLESADVGNFMTISAWTRGVMGHLDTTGDRSLTFAELARVLVSQAKGQASAPIGPVGGNAMERLNNAIAGLDTLATTDSAMPAGNKAAVRALATHWAKFWTSNQRTFTPDWLLSNTAADYVRWYTRAWLLCSPDVQRRAVRPDQIDVSWAELTKGSVAAWHEGKQDAVKAGKDAASFAATEAARLAGELAKELRDTLLIAAIAIGCFFIATR